MTDNEIRQAIDSNLSTVHLSQHAVNRLATRIAEGKNVKKKLSAGLVLALTLLLAVTALAATVLTGYLHLNTNGGSPTSAVAIDDTLYLMTNRGLMTWRGGGEAAQPEVSAQALQKLGLSIDALLFDDGGPMLLDLRSETVWAYRDGELQQILSYRDTGVDFSGAYIKSVVQQDGELYLLAAHETETTLYRWNLEQNTLEALPVTGIVSLAKYKSGALLCIQRDYSAWDRVISIDTKRGGLTVFSTLPLMSVTGVAYARDYGAVYAMVNGSLQCLANHEWQVVRDRSIPANSFYFAVFQGGYVAVSPNGVQYVSFDGEETGNPVRIAGYTSTANLSFNLDNSFEATHPGATVIRQISPHYCAEEIRQAVQSGEDVDLFHVRLDANVLALIANGTLAPIDVDTALAEVCRTMLPPIADALFAQGALYAVPSEMMVYSWEAAAPENARATTLGELLAANADIGNDYANTAWGREEYARYLLEQAVMAAPGTPDFTSGEFLGTLQTLCGANLPQWPVYGAQADYSAAVGYTMYGKEEEAYPMLPPTLAAQDAPQVPARMMVYVLNPNSQNKAGALEYLAYIASHYDKTTAALFWPDQAQSVLFPGFQDTIDEENAMASPNADLIGSILNNPTFWMITDTALAYYRDTLAPRLNLRLEPLLADTYGWHDQTFPRMMDAVLACLDGDDTPEACAAALNALLSGE